MSEVIKIRLIDADAFIEENKEIIDCEIDHPKYQDTIRELIDQAPTIKTFTLADIEEQYRNGLEKGLEEAERPHVKWQYEKLRPHGEWKKRTIGYLSTHECSNCDFNGDWLWNFCPNCGAKMQKEW